MSNTVVHRLAGLLVVLLLLQGLVAATMASAQSGQAVSGVLAATPVVDMPVTVATGYPPPTRQQQIKAAVEALPKPPPGAPLPVVRAAEPEAAAIRRCLEAIPPALLAAALPSMETGIASPVYSLQPVPNPLPPASPRAQPVSRLAALFATPELGHGGRPLRFEPAAFFARCLAADPAFWGTDQYWADLEWLWEHESGFDPRLVNPYSGACGISQLHPCTAKLRNISWVEQVRLGLIHIRQQRPDKFRNPSQAKQHWWRLGHDCIVGGRPDRCGGSY